MDLDVDEGCREALRRSCGPISGVVTLNARFDFIRGADVVAAIGASEDVDVMANCRPGLSMNSGQALRLAPPAQGYSTRARGADARET